MICIFNLLRLPPPREGGATNPLFAIKAIPQVSHPQDSTAPPKKTLKKTPTPVPNHPCPRPLRIPKPATVDRGGGAGRRGRLRPQELETHWTGPYVAPVAVAWFSFPVLHREIMDPSPSQKPRICALLPSSGICHPPGKSSGSCPGVQSDQHGSSRSCSGVPPNRNIMDPPPQKPRICALFPSPGNFHPPGIFRGGMGSFQGVPPSHTPRPTTPNPKNPPSGYRPRTPFHVLPATSLTPRLPSTPPPGVDALCQTTGSTPPPMCGPGTEASNLVWAFARLGIPCLPFLEALALRGRLNPSPLGIPPAL